MPDPLLPGLVLAAVLLLVLAGSTLWSRRRARPRPPSPYRPRQHRAPPLTPMPSPTAHDLDQHPHLILFPLYPVTMGAPIPADDPPACRPVATSTPDTSGGELPSSESTSGSEW
ncbi:hypothetical protein [uncultured Deinococcus sp.]|uniref:hypothetical protein n=1 Tax=uncultured Deinococcus sp. TaxID=158789 RepID=UPI0025DF35C6|nr:hypothetical protein [uncultured Deinococcus sp.]